MLAFIITHAYESSWQASGKIATEQDRKWGNYSLADVAKKLFLKNKQKQKWDMLVIPALGRQS